MTPDDLKIVRRAYAKQITAAVRIVDERVETAFAEVRREYLLRFGPWLIFRMRKAYVPTPTADPVFLKAAIAFYASLGITVERVMTDNGSCYRSKAFAKACRKLGLKHVRTKPYTPKTNGKAERFIRTALREWAYAIAFPTSDRRPPSFQSGFTDTIGIDRTAA